MDAYTYLESPSPQDAARFVNTYKKRGIVLVYGLCEVSYEGRAAAHLEPMYRLVIIKKDGTLLVHESEKREPRIWNPPPSSNVALTVDGVLVIKSVRSRPLETVIVRVPAVSFVGFFPASSAPYRVHGTEKDMVRFLASNVGLIEEGAMLLGVEVPTVAGSVDLLLRGINGDLIVVEVKRDLAGPEAVHQLKRYVDYFTSKGEKVRGVLASPDISASAYKYLKEYGLEYRRLSPKQAFPA